MTTTEQTEIPTPEREPMTSTEQQPPAPDFPRPVATYCSERYGLLVGQIGEDGAMVLLGHHADRRRVVAAFAADARLTVGERLTETLPNLTYSDIASEVNECWAVVTEPCGEHVRSYMSDPACKPCRELGASNGGEWHLWWSTAITAKTPDAFPVTVLELW